MKEAGDPDFEAARASLANVGDARRSGSNPRASINMADMKNLMKNQLANANVYEDAARVGNTGGQRTGSAKRATVMPGAKSPTSNKQASPLGSPKAGGPMAQKRQTSAGRRV